MGLLTGKADNKEQYRSVWSAHVNDLRILMNAAELPGETQDDILGMLHDTVNEAADKEFPDG